MEFTTPTPPRLRLHFLDTHETASQDTAADWIISRSAHLYQRYAACSWPGIEWRLIWSIVVGGSVPCSAWLTWESVWLDDRPHDVVNGANNLHCDCLHWHGATLWIYQQQQQQQQHRATTAPRCCITYILAGTPHLFFPSIDEYSHDTNYRAQRFKKQWQLWYRVVQNVSQRVFVSK